MNITRRSFVKRTAFSAAALTILGQGVALAGDGDTGRIAYKAKYDITTFDVTDQNYKYPNTPAGQAAALAKAQELTGMAIKTPGVWGNVVPNSASTGKKKDYKTPCFIISPASAFTTGFKVNADGTVSPHAKNTTAQRITYQWLQK